MRAINLDYVRKPLQSRRIELALLVIGLFLITYLIGIYFVQRNLLNVALEKNNVLIKAKNHSISQSGSELRETSGELLNFADDVTSRLNFPWNELFLELESSTDLGITFLTVEPNRIKREIIIIAEAKDFSKMLGYLNHLNTSQHLSNAHLTSHQLLTQDTHGAVRFELNARWEYQ